MAAEMSDSETGRAGRRCGEPSRRSTSATAAPSAGIVHWSRARVSQGAGECPEPERGTEAEGRLVSVARRQHVLARSRDRRRARARASQSARAAPRARPRSSDTTPPETSRQSRLRHPTREQRANGTPKPRRTRQRQPAAERLQDNSAAAPPVTSAGRLPDAEQERAARRVASRCRRRATRRHRSPRRRSRPRRVSVAPETTPARRRRRVRRGRRPRSVADRVGRLGEPRSTTAAALPRSSASGAGVVATRRGWARAAPAQETRRAHDRDENRADSLMQVLRPGWLRIDAPIRAARA